MRITKRIRHWLPLLPLLALLGATYWLDQQARPDPDIPASGLRHEPDAIVDGFSVTNLNKAGSPSFILNADRMLHFSDDDSTDLDAPHITLLDENNLPLYASAQTGNITSKGNEIILSGGVAVQRGASDEKNAMNLKTEFLRILPEQGLLDTDKAIELTKTDSIVNAVGLALNNNTRTIQLLSRVTVEYVSEIR
ncbi:MAG: LPS export ABC transporter periplasmic protein LptC [Gallionella sp.]